MNRKYRLPFALCMASVWIFIVYYSTGIFFETNDDRIISEIFSGAMTGIPEAHTYYVDYMLGVLLSSLYRITTAIPWYGGMLVLFQFLCCFFIADAFFSVCRNKKDYFLALPLIALIYAAEIYIIASIQYTSTAAMLAITGYLCFLLYPEKKSRCFTFFLLEFLSFLLRSNAMLMIQPMGFLVIWGFYFSSSVDGKKGMSKYRPIFQAGAILFVILILGKGSYVFFHSSPGWKEYEKVNDAVTEITDYAAIPAYAEVQHILKKYNVTEKQYKAFLQYAMIEENLSGDCLLEIAEIAHTQNTPPAFSQVFGQLLNSYTTREYWSLNFLLLASWSVLIFCLFFKKTFSLLIPAAGLLLGRSALWLFLLYEGRVPPRVMVPLYLGEILFLFCLFFLTVAEKAYAPLSSFTMQQQEDMTNSHIAHSTESPLIHNPHRGNSIYRRITAEYLPALLILLLLPFGAKTFKNQFLYLSEKNATESIYFQGMQDMISYCNNHPEKRYFIDASTLIYYRGSAFETKIYGPRNAVITGCWYSGTPVLYEYEKNYFSGCNSLYLVTSSDMEMQSGMVLEYLEERLETTAYLDDTFTVSNGGKYLVYAFSF